MNNNDLEVFRNDMLAMGELYNKRITDPLLSLYWKALKDVTIEQFKSASSAHMLNPDNGQFFPKPADLMRQLHGTTQQQKQSTENRSKLAWSTIMGEVRRIGSYGTLEIEDKQAMAALRDIGGWKHLCMSTHDQLVWMEKEFVKAYDCYENTPVNALPSKLPGLIELDQRDRESSKTMAELLQRMKPKSLEHKE